jgi:rhodanese-related sulfurtransferase
MQPAHLGVLEELSVMDWLGFLRTYWTTLLGVVLLISISFGLVACSKATSATDDVDWTTQQLADKLAKGETFRLIDVREPDEYAAGHIPGAELMPLGQLTQYLSALKPEEEIVVICRSGNRSQQAVRLLKQHGYTKVRNVMGGMLSWQGSVKTGLAQ